MPIEKKYYDENDGTYFTIKHFVKEKIITFFIYDTDNQYINVCLKLNDIEELNLDLLKIINNFKKNEGGKNG
jgi:hypothetical protein